MSDKPFHITEEAIAAAEMTVTTDRAKEFIRAVERSHDRIRKEGDAWWNNPGNFPWRVAGEAIGEDRPFVELAQLMDDLGIAERVVNEEFFCMSAREIMTAALDDATTNLVMIATGWEDPADVTIVRQKEATTVSSLDKDGNEIKDGFRKRRKRPSGWITKAIKEGSVRDPDAPDPDAGKDYSDATVVQPPIAAVDSEGT